MAHQTAQNQKFQYLITVFSSHQIQSFLVIWPLTFKTDPEFCYISPLWSPPTLLVQACNVAHTSRATASSLLSRRPARSTHPTLRCPSLSDKGQTLQPVVQFPSSSASGEPGQWKGTLGLARLTEIGVCLYGGGMKQDRKMGSTCSGPSSMVSSQTHCFLSLGLSLPVCSIE